MLYMTSIFALLPGSYSEIVGKLVKIKKCQLKGIMMQVDNGEAKVHTESS